MYMVDALTGFSNAFFKVGSRRGSDLEYEIRVVGLRKDSAHIILHAFEWVKTNAAAATVLVTAGTALTGGAYKIVKDIAKVIGAKKHIRGDLAGATINFNGPIVIISNDKDEPYELTKEEYELLQSKILDSDLDKLTSPLQPKKIDTFKVQAKKEVLSSIDANERQYFVVRENESISSKDGIWMEGSLNSLSKDRNRGTFHTLSGKHIAYRYVGDDKQQLLNAFTHEGLIRAHSKVSFSRDLNPISLEIDAIELGQRDLSFGESSKEQDHKFSKDLNSDAE